MLKVQTQCDGSKSKSSSKNFAVVFKIQLLIDLKTRTLDGLKTIFELKRNAFIEKLIKKEIAIKG